MNPVLCRSSGCQLRAKWRCIIVMPNPPMKLGLRDGDRTRIDSGVAVCDRHRMQATTEQVLGPVGYHALTFAFRKLGKKPPALGELSVHFQSIEYSRLDGSESQPLAQFEPPVPPKAPKVIDIRDANNVRVISGGGNEDDK